LTGSGGGAAPAGFAALKPPKIPLRFAGGAATGSTGGASAGLAGSAGAAGFFAANRWKPFLRAARREARRRAEPRGSGRIASAARRPTEAARGARSGVAERALLVLGHGRLRIGGLHLGRGRHDLLVHGKREGRTGRHG
jgi:hypothetical protein